METSQGPQNLICNICWPLKTFKLKHHLRNHQRTVHRMQVTVPGHYKCLEEGCNQTFRYVEQLREHLNHFHSNYHGKFYVQEIKFTSFEDFEEWKRQEEEHCIARYIKSNSGSKMTKSGMHHKYYVCSRSGKVRLTGKGIRKLKRQGSSKLNTRCTASIKADIHPSGFVSVKYCKEHYGHEQGIKNIGHVGLSQYDRNWLANQILEGVPLDTILLKIQEGRGRPNSERLLMTTKTDLRNIRRQYGLHLPINKLFTCLEPGCNLTLENIRGAREKLRNHLEQQHNLSFDIHKETFSSDEELEVWKSQLEAEAGIVFVRGNIRNFKSGRTRTYYRCSLSGVQKTKGNHQTVCTAEMIVVREMSGAQSVTYCLDHYGHQLNTLEVLTAVQNIKEHPTFVIDPTNNKTEKIAADKRNEEALIIDPSTLKCEKSIVIDGPQILNPQSSNNTDIHVFTEPVVVSHESLSSPQLSSPQPAPDGQKIMEVMHPLIYSTHMDSPPSQLVQIIPLPSDVNFENIDEGSKKPQINVTCKGKSNTSLNESDKKPKTELGLWISSIFLPAVEACKDRQHIALVRHRLEEALEILNSKDKKWISSPIITGTRINLMTQKENKEQIKKTIENDDKISSFKTSVGPKVKIFQQRNTSENEKVTVLGNTIDSSMKNNSLVKVCDSGPNISPGRVLVQMETVSGSKGKVMLGRALSKTYQNETSSSNCALQKKRENEQPSNYLYKKRLKQSEERLFLPDEERSWKFRPNGADDVESSILVGVIDEVIKPLHKSKRSLPETVIKTKKVITKSIESSMQKSWVNLETIGKSKDIQVNSDGIRVAREEVVASEDSIL